MKVIVVTGTPGTGKTLLSRKLAKKLGFYYIDVNKIISKNKLSESYDGKRKSKVVDIKKLNNFLIGCICEFKKLNKKNKKYSGIVVDSHLSHYLPRKYVDF